MLPTATIFSPAGESTPAQPAQSTIVYVDGFNLYRGVLRDSDFRWLDLFTLFRRLRNPENVVAVKYFTAPVLGQQKKWRQQIYLDALTATGVEVILGKYTLRRTKCNVDACRLSSCRDFQMPEEKQTDVNIAVALVTDAIFKACTHQVLVTADSDQCPAVKMAATRGSRVSLIIPVENGVLGNNALDLRQAASGRAIALPLDELARAQLPDPVPRKAPLKPVKKPDGW